MFKALITSAALAIACATPGFADGHSTAPEGAAAYFIGLEDGATVTSPVTIHFGLSGMGVAPAGTEKDGTGHHHILIDRAPFGDAPDDAEAMANGLPSDEHHRHFGGGQTEVTLDLTPGSHTLQLVLGDAYHVPHDPIVASKRITITVK